MIFCTSDVQLELVDQDLVISFAGTPGGITVKNYYGVGVNTIKHIVLNNQQQRLSVLALLRSLMP